MPDATTTQDSPITPTPEQQQAAATSGPSPSAAAAPASSGAILGSQASAAPAPAQPSPQQQAQQADVAHHFSLGKVASALLGKQTEYSVDPQTGKTIATEVPQKPGDLFRSILSGAILGMAAGKSQRSALAGFAAGGKAGLENSQQMDQQRRAAAQQQFQNQEAAARSQREKQGESRADQQIAMEKQKNTAQFEMFNKEMILHERDANLRDAEFNQRANESATQMQRWSHEAGGVDAPLPDNNKVGNGAAMQKLYTQYPEKFKAPPGYDRFITQDHDTTGLTYDKEKGYVDSEGNPVNLEDRTTWHVSFIPQKQQPLDIDGATLNRLFPKTMGGVASPKQVYRMPFDQLAGLATSEHEMTRRDADENYKRVHDDIRADMDELKSKANNFTRQADEAERQGDTAAAKQLRQQAQDAFDEYDETKMKANPHSPLRKSDSGRAGTVDMATITANAPKADLKPNETLMFDPKKRNYQAVDNGDVEAAKKNGAVVVPGNAGTANSAYPVSLPDGSSISVNPDQIGFYMRSNPGARVSPADQGRLQQQLQREQQQRQQDEETQRQSDINSPA
jgi:hypothetical protein